MTLMIKHIVKKLNNKFYLKTEEKKPKLNEIKMKAKKQEMN